MANVENIKKWVDALRSGKYVQGQHKLEKFDVKSDQVQHCCLGVACRVAMENGVALKAAFTEEGVQFFSYNEHLETEYLPDPVAEWLGIDVHVEVNDPDNGDTVQLTHANDDYGWSFDGIANAIEAKFLRDHSDAT